MFTQEERSRIITCVPWGIIIDQLMKEMDIAIKVNGVEGVPFSIKRVTFSANCLAGLRVSCASNEYIS